MLDMISKILNIILAVVTAYFYFENKKLKKYNTEKELIMKKAELLKLNKDHLEITVGAGAYDYKKSMFDMSKEENEYYYRISCLEAEIEYLEKILKDKNK